MRPSPIDERDPVYQEYLKRNGPVQKFPTAFAVVSTGSTSKADKEALGQYNDAKERHKAAEIRSGTPEARAADAENKARLVRAVRPLIKQWREQNPHISQTGIAARLNETHLKPIIGDTWSRGNVSWVEHYQLVPKAKR